MRIWLRAACWAMALLALAACTNPLGLEEAPDFAEHTTSSGNHTSSSGNAAPLGR